MTAGRAAELRTAVVDDDVLTVVLDEPDGATIAWELRSPTGWTGDLLQLVARSD